MSETDGMKAIKEVLRETFGAQAEGVTADTTAADIPEWDSLKMVSIILSVQKRFGIVFKNRDIDRIGNVGDFAALIDRSITGN